MWPASSLPGPIILTTISGSLLLLPAILAFATSFLNQNRRRRYISYRSYDCFTTYPDGRDSLNALSTENTSTIDNFLGGLLTVSIMVGTAFQCNCNLNY